jgi:hypothetical protein
LLHAQTPSRQRQRPVGHGSRRATFRPAVEGLEDRQLLSAMAPVTPSVNLYDGVYYERNGGLYLNQPQRGACFFPLSGPCSPSPADTLVAPVGLVKQVSCGIHDDPVGTPGFSPSETDAVFVLDTTGTVHEYYAQYTPVMGLSGTYYNLSYQSGPTFYNVAEISASQLSSDTFFMRRTDGSVWESSNGHLAAVWAPAGIDPKSATQISTGLAGSTGKEAVFVNFAGALYEHAGTSPTSGWSYVTGNYKPTSWLQSMFVVSDFSASQIESDTVFVIKPGTFLGASQLSVHVGTDPNSGWTGLASGVVQVSAGEDSLGKAAAFYTTTSNALYECPSSGPVVQVAGNNSNVAYVVASQSNLDTVCYGYAGALYGYCSFEFGGPYWTVWVNY